MTHSGEQDVQGCANMRNLPGVMSKLVSGHCRAPSKVKHYNEDSTPDLTMVFSILHRTRNMKILTLVEVFIVRLPSSAYDDH